jgi:hypothetical protein
LLAKGHALYLLGNDYRYSTATGLLKMSEISGKIRDILSVYYFVFESYFLTFSIKKALAIDFYDIKSNDIVSTVVDDVFFLLKKVLTRSITTQDIDTVCVVLNITYHSIEVDYLPGLKQKIIDLSSIASSFSKSDKLAFMVLNFLIFRSY